MLKLKFSPLILFIILLVVLIFSTIICKTCFLNSSKTEGFVSYQYDKNTTQSPNTLFMVDFVSIVMLVTFTSIFKENPCCKIVRQFIFR